ncbi:hypothetical protein C672_3505 [[Clostridium] bifermentans ATCC 638]|uniref:Uncharacterized protein n=1 Tax=Paraclostridium bifermentans ATCC 638 = DSM 14991 TaxID=1233171 RepID=T4VEP9_PARBF|nr:hypothetical protein [Paraclostridium bifermentans]EQK39998.1 hypothetical protein C672_3505 [[Clostridium] bifermentans ATCC 638] [Paraclostridium bifermentans ATCC 638 = DSM 14991]RIZ57505.1 hypothetical protein CHH45_16050 [Paraclostridium bifermentans]UAG19973.1 hypothetical protein KXZ80_16985 [Paraclostridium bifermentans]
MVEPKILEYIENLLLDYLENDNIEVRKCDVCNSYMIEGYCIEEGTSYYCTDECMLTEMTIEEFNNLYADGEGDSYFTTWEANRKEYNAIKEILNSFSKITNIKLK